MSYPVQAMIYREGSAITAFFNGTKKAIAMVIVGPRLGATARVTVSAQARASRSRSSTRLPASAHACTSAIL
ncbi:hypothetical protein [Rhizobium sp. SEMIA 4085]|uniref:hypothetical protein n=1 Tax=Rhizobium sp. SEMIA 4085 TaxID=2137761 RepID=UPI000589BEC9|nr:hypothetical protein [Rhizobium sp. SEMIA 4085]